MEELALKSVMSSSNVKRASLALIATVWLSVLVTGLLAPGSMIGDVWLRGVN
jgi:hypothetical protein